MARQLPVDLNEIGLVIEIAAIADSSECFEFFMKEFILEGIPETGNFAKTYRGYAHIL